MWLLYEKYIIHWKWATKVAWLGRNSDKSMVLMRVQCRIQEALRTFIVVYLLGFFLYKGMLTEKNITNANSIKPIIIIIIIIMIIIIIIIIIKKRNM